MPLESVKCVKDAEHPPDSGQEREWVAMARRGEAAGWEQLHRNYYAGMKSLALRVVQDDALAEDVVQEAFIKAFRTLEKFRGESKFSTWLYRVALNQAYDTARKRQRRQKWLGLFPVTNEDEPVYEAVDETDASRLAQHRDLGAALKRALGKLNEEQRAVVELRLIQGFSTDETARILKCKRGTVLSRLYYSCQKLKTLLEKEHEELGNV
jgi:RNA polymerase sigma-70 factor (ECF subfamily)